LESRKLILKAKILPAKYAKDAESKTKTIIKIPFSRFFAHFAGKLLISKQLLRKFSRKKSRPKI